MSNLGGIVKQWFLTFYGICLSFASRRLNREITRRNSCRGQGTLQWLTLEEAAVVIALAKIIVPSDDETPGLDDIDVLGPSAIDVLDKLIKKNPYKQELYARGLLSFDVWASKKHDRQFAAMTTSNQVTIFREAQLYSQRLHNGPRPLRALYMLLGVTQSGKGRFFAAQLYPEIRNDCLQAFYTSRVSWIWLEYDGPPMDEGYPRLQARH
jgi:hypothetical protein